MFEKRMLTHIIVLIKWTWHPVRLNVRLQSTPISTKSCPKITTKVFTLKLMFFKVAQKVTKCFGHFSRHICHQELSKIAQSGHTDVKDRA